VDQFPPQVQSDRIAPVCAPIPGYAFRCSVVLDPRAATSHNLVSSFSANIPLCLRLKGCNSTDGT
jgi:hypothetical protein